MEYVCERREGEEEEGERVREGGRGEGGRDGGNEPTHRNSLFQVSRVQEEGREEEVIPHNLSTSWCLY